MGNPIHSKKCLTKHIDDFGQMLERDVQVEKYAYLYSYRRFIMLFSLICPVLITAVLTSLYS